MQILLPIVALTASLSLQTPLQEQLSGLLSAAPGERAAQIERILEGGVEASALGAALAQGVRPMAPREELVAGWSESQVPDTEGITRPYQIYLPESVAGGADPTLLLVHMHGAVGREDFGEGLGSASATGYGGILWPELAETHGFVVACPQGRADTLWWRDEGVNHVQAMIRDLRGRLPIPDRSIFASGFSDGASGCYYLAMAAPDPFCGFIAMNGLPAVASSQSGRQLYLRNMWMTRTVAAMTQEDSLYPSHTVLPHLTAAIRKGADMLVLSYPDMNHQPSYFEEQSGVFARFLTETARDDDAERVRWLASEAALGKARWLDLRVLGPGESDAEAYLDINVMTDPGSVRLGVALQTSGTEVSRVVEASAAEQAGLRVGDQLLAFDGTALGSTRDLRAALRGKTYGDAFVLSVQREEEKLDLEGTFPGFVPEPIYTRKDPTAFADCSLELKEDTLQIQLLCRGVRQLRIWLTAEQAGAEQVQLSANGASVVCTVQHLSPREILERFAREGDASALRPSFVDLVLP